MNKTRLARGPVSSDSSGPRESTTSNYDTEQLSALLDESQRSHATQIDSVAEPDTEPATLLLRRSPALPGRPTPETLIAPIGKTPAPGRAVNTYAMSSARRRFPPRRSLVLGVGALLAVLFATISSTVTDENPASVVAAGPIADAPDEEQSPTPQPVPTNTNQTTGAQATNGDLDAAVAQLVGGDYRQAHTEYAAVSRAAPNNEVHALIVQVLHRKIAERCARSTEGDSSCSTNP